MGNMTRSVPQVLDVLCVRPTLGFLWREAEQNKSQLNDKCRGCHSLDKRTPNEQSIVRTALYFLLSRENSVSLCALQWAYKYTYALQQLKTTHKKAKELQVRLV